VHTLDQKVVKADPLQYRITPFRSTKNISGRTLHTSGPKTPNAHQMN
jgi:hypothetical protein